MTDKPKLELVDSPTDSVFDDIEALRKTATIKVTRRVVRSTWRSASPRATSISGATRTRRCRWMRRCWWALKDQTISISSCPSC